ncbi:3-isopropylmalate dehydratase large subunit [Candidatus Woesearchaeota archaeon]|nr:3-isopropylmalate dehydratase large subunit [Candidatus Woesearchaeota archaeon]|tara:strand:- start:3642 stop:4883 length:1242 start_codon:yes stop_codon:yes gene_type:complete
MGTLVEEIFSRKLGKKVKAGEIVLADVDYAISHDTTTPLAIKAWEDIGKPLFNKDMIVIVFDHYYPSPNIDGANTQKDIRGFVKKHNIKSWLFNGVCHQLMVEKGFALPGNIVVGGDSHTCTYGALGCFSTGMGSTDIGVVWATGKNWFRVPETININVNGKFKEGVYAKDLILKIINIIGADGATYKSLEFTGETIENMEIHERLTLSNMAIEAGAKCGLIKTDKKTKEFFKKMGVNEIEDIAPDKPNYEKTVTIDVSTLDPQIAYPNRVDNVKDIKEFEGLELDEVFIGTCTNGRYEDLEIAANILKGKKVNKYCRVIILPASAEIYKKALENGLVKIFLDAGATVGIPGCGACVGRHQGVLGDGERALTTMNRNFTGRMGSPKSEIYLASPATCAVSAIHGKITDPGEAL